MPVKTNDLAGRVRRYEAKIEEAIARVIASGWFVLGPEVDHFEHAFARYVGAEFCVGLANGTDAIEIGLRALGISTGSHVATVANAGMYTTTAILAIGAYPFYMDVNISNQNVSLSEVERALDCNVDAVVITHLYGLAVEEVAQVRAMCRQKAVPLLEDCAQAHGAMIHNKRVGTFGDVAAFSFYPTKNLGALGDGGAVVTDVSWVADNVKKLRQYGWSTKYLVGLSGGKNSRLDELQAAVLQVFLPDLDKQNARRLDIANRYSKKITNQYVQTPELHGAEYVAHLYVIRSEHRDKLRTYLGEFGINTDIHYPIPDHCQAIFNEESTVQCLPNTEQLAKEVVTIPCYPELSDEKIGQVIHAINSWIP